MLTQQILKALPANCLSVPEIDAEESSLCLVEDDETSMEPCRRGPSVAVLISDADAIVEPVRGWVVNRSTDGLRLELTEEGDVDPGTILSVKAVESSRAIPWIQVKVIHQRRIRTGWELECDYLRIPPWSIRMIFG
jgi:hypothetical protein